MEPKVIQLITEKILELRKEVQTLYELSDAEMILMSTVMMDLPMSMPPTLLAKLLKAIVHFIERNHDIAVEVSKLTKS